MTRLSMSPGSTSVLELTAFLLHGDLSFTIIHISTLAGGGYGHETSTSGNFLRDASREHFTLNASNVIRFHISVETYDNYYVKWNEFF